MTKERCHIRSMGTPITKASIDKATDEVTKKLRQILTDK